MPGFLSIMKLIIFFICVPFVYSGTHSFTTLYSEMNSPHFSEISSLSTLDGRQIDYYDSKIKMLIPRQDWMKEFTSGDRFKEYTEIRERVQQTNKINITVVMERFNHSYGVHTYQRVYGCDWDDETGDSHGFDQHGYDVEDFISLDLKEFKYITAVPQGLITIHKWNNNNRAQLEFLQQYYRHDCVDWSKYFLMLRKADLERIAPEVSLLQKDSSSPVSCHVTGFYPSGMTIYWFRNGQDHDEDVDLGELLPNMDGTFQKTSNLNITPNEWKKDQYVRQVEHQGKTIWKIGENIKSNDNNWYTRNFCVVYHKVKDHPEDSD